MQASPLSLRELTHANCQRRAATASHRTPKQSIYGCFSRLLSTDGPITPGSIPDVTALQPLGHRVQAVSPARPAAHETEQPHPAARPKSVAGDCLRGIFGTGRQMTARTADKAGERGLIEAHEPDADQATRRAPPRAGIVAAPPCISGFMPV